MPDLDELAAALLPGAEGLVAPAGRDAAARTIAWVRLLRPRVPAFDVLEAGDLAIVPLSALAVVAPDTDAVWALVAGCAAAGVAGLLVVGSEPDAKGERALAPLQADLVAAAGAHDLPVARVGQMDPVALERSVIGYLVTGGAELDRQAAALERRLERLALDGGGPASLVAAIATFFGRAVALEGRRGDVLATHAPAELPEAALAAARYQARPRGPVALRAKLPPVGTTGVETGARGRPTELSAGSLVLLGDGPPSDLERVATARIAGLVALELARDEVVRRVRGVRGGESLPTAGPPWVVLLARQRDVGDADDGPGATGRRETMRRELGLLAPARRLALRGDADSLEVRAILAVDPAGGPDPAGLILAGRIAAFLGRTVAVSRPFAAAAERPAAEAEARATLEAGESLPDVGPILEAARLPVYRILGGMHHLGDGDRLARALLEPLLASRPDVRQEHLDTLRATLDRGSVGEAATALGVHRNTVTYRLARIEALTGWRLADPDLRLALSIGLRLVQDS